MRAKSRRGRPKQSEPHPVDIHVGSRLRQQRTELGISQQNLAATLGVAFQQVQKYEQARNRISGSRLYRLSKALDVPVTFFFEGITFSTLTTELAAPPAASEYTDPLDTPESTELLAAYHAIPDPLTQRRLRDLAKTLATGPDRTASNARRSGVRKRSRRERV